MYIISVLGLRGLFSAPTPMEHHVHPSLETTDLQSPIQVEGIDMMGYCQLLQRDQLCHLHLSATQPHHYAS
jgi:hypothetical protein